MMTEKTEITPKIAHISPLAAGFFVFAVLMAFWYTLRSSETRRLNRETRLEAEIMSAFMRTDLDHRFDALDRMHHAWELRGGIPREEWEKDVARVVEQQPGWKAIEWVNTNYVVKWVVPLAGNEKAVDLNLSFEEKRRETLDRVKESDRPLMTAAITLVQGGMGSLFVFPLRIDDQFSGFMLAVFDLEQWIQHVLALHPREFTYAVRFNGQLVRSVESSLAAEEASGSMQVTWDAYGNQWTVEAFPDALLQERRNPILGAPGILANFVLSVLVGMIIRLARMAMKREKQLRIISDELRQSNQELERFAYVASHDLREPLRGISHLVDWLEEDAGQKLSPEATEHLQNIRKRTARMDHLLMDLLHYAQAGRTLGKVDWIDTCILVREIWELQNPSDRARLEIASGMPVLETYTAPLRQVFTNLISNALKHAPDRAMTISVSAQPEGNRFFAFEVADDGNGIPRSHQEKVFELFQTLRSRDDVEGSGMGLAIVKKTVESMGGRITLISDEGRGCRFRFTWPLRVQSVAGATSPGG